MDDESREMRAHAWQYFALHAGQRISMFNFFLVLTGLVAAGLAACLRGDGVLPVIGTGLGIFLTFVAFVFHKLDERTSFFVKHAEGALIKLEAAFAIPEARLFTQEAPATVAGGLRSLSARMWTYSMSFRFVFVITGLAGLAAALVSFARAVKVIPT